MESYNKCTTKGCKLQAYPGSNYCKKHHPCREYLVKEFAAGISDTKISKAKDVISKHSSDQEYIRGFVDSMPRDEACNLIIGWVADSVKKEEANYSILFGDITESILKKEPDIFDELRKSETEVYHKKFSYAGYADKLKLLFGGEE